MRVVNFSEARNSLKNVIDQVIDDADYTVIARRDAPDAVVMSLDTFNGLMMIPNLIGVLALSGTVVDITRNYFARRVRGEDIEPMWSAFEEYQKEEEAEAAAEEAELEKAANK